MTLYTLLLAVVLPACAAENRVAPELPALPAPVVIPLAPLLAGGLSETPSAAAARVEAHAGRLLSLGEGGRLSPSAAADYLGPLARPEAHVMDRAAAGILARALAEPGAVEELVRNHPGLRDGPVAGMRDFLLESSAYRGNMTRNAMTDLYETVGRDPLVNRLFDGDVERDIRLDDALLKGSDLYVGKREGRLLRSTADSYYFEHPSIPGAMVEVSRRQQEVASDPAALDPAGQAAAGILARSGAGPRYFGQTIVPVKRLFWKPDAPTARVLEAVYGRTVGDLIRDLSFTSAEHALVEKMIFAAAEAGVDTDGATEDRIMIGRTATDPALKAYLLKADRPDASADPAVRKAKAEGWLAHFRRLVAEQTRTYLRAYSQMRFYK